MILAESSNGQSLMNDERIFTIVRSNAGNAEESDIVLTFAEVGGFIRPTDLQVLLLASPSKLWDAMLIIASAPLISLSLERPEIMKEYMRPVCRL